jgi:nucleoside-diphosphate-sugar epimerase
MNNTQTILVTGGAGFVGSNLVRRLLDKNYVVHLILKRTSNTWRITDVLQKLEVHHGDIIDAEFVRNLVEEVQPDIIYHLATHGGYTYQSDAESILRTNIFGTLNLLNACAKVDYKVFVNTGSSAEYGVKSHAMKETDILEPNTYYAVSKATQTLLCQHIAWSENRPICTLRLFSVYGPYEEPSRLVPAVINSCLRGEDIALSLPETSRDFIFIDDVVDVYLQIDRLSQLSGEILNVGTGTLSTLKDVVSTVIRLTNAKVKAMWGAMPPRTFDTDIWVADRTKIFRLLKWQPKWSLEKGLLSTIRWYRDRLEKKKN